MTFQFPPSFSSHKHTKNIHQSGFTLVELLVYMGLLMIFVMMTSEIFLSLLESKVESVATASVEQDSAYILSRLEYDVSRASTITTPAALGSNGSSLALVIGGVTYTYSVNAGHLQLSSVNGTFQITSGETEVTNVDFKRLGNAGGKDTVRFTMTLQSVTQRRSGKEIRTITSTVGRRQ